MALLERVRVKLLSEAAGCVTGTRVIERDFPIQELMEAVVAVAGKNVERIRQLLRAGSIMASAVLPARLVGARPVSLGQLQRHPSIPESFNPSVPRLLYPRIGCTALTSDT